MKTIAKRVIRNEKGYALTIVLILLVVGGLVLTPLLGLMSTGLLSGQVYEEKMDLYYAADAGVEDAIWKIKHDVPGSYPYEYPEPLFVNDRSVDVVIYREDMDPDPCGENFTYQILSTARSIDGSATKIDAHIVTTIKYLSMLEHLVTIHGGLTLQQIKDLENDLSKLDVPCPSGCLECEKCRKVYDYNSDDYKNIPQECKGCIAVYNFPANGWPTAGNLSALYWEDVEGGTHYDGDTEIDLSGVDMNLGPLYVDGKLDICNTNKDEEATLTIDGTFYITGETKIYGFNAKEPYNLTLDLNGQTIFIMNNSAEALEIKYCNIIGPGAVIAVGDVRFAPKAVSGETDPIFVMSVEGTTRLQPSGDFCGAIAGSVDVEIKTGNPNVSYPEGGFGDLNFPSLFGADRSYSIASWEISPV